MTAEEVEQIREDKALYKDERALEKQTQEVAPPEDNRPYHASESIYLPTYLPTYPTKLRSEERRVGKEC